jgi:hypothetical protein
MASVSYIDLGYDDPRSLWDEVVLPACSRFLKEPDRQNAMTASILLAHLLDWIWHRDHPGVDTRDNSAYRTFRKDHRAACPELAWITDICDATKHRGLSRPKKVSGIQGQGRPNDEGTVFDVYGSRPMPAAKPLEIHLDDGSAHQLEAVMRRALEYCKGLV